MEVHHHSKVSLKNWKEYLKEFLMLFIAVFCGFLAEDILEHKIENEWEKEYMESYLEDLKGDIKMLESTIIFSENLSSGLDTLQSLLYQSDWSTVSHFEVYEHNFKYDRWILPIFNDQTYAELRYSGNMVFIRKRDIIRGLSKYTALATQISLNSKAFIETVTKLEDDALEIFNKQFVTFGEVDPATGFSKITVSPNANLLTKENEVLIKYANRIGRLLHINNNFLLPFLKQQLSHAKELSSLIEKEYNLN